MTKYSQARARAHAQRIAKECGTDVRLVIDTDMGDQAYLAVERDTNAIVVYLDDPDTQCSTGNHPGRFVAV